MKESLIDQIKNITTSSGIYKFIDRNDEILYIGKAKNLRKRLISYTKTDKLSSRISRMTFLAERLEVTLTNSDLEAILLEHNLIKKHKPKFNILLKDDKRFSSIAIDKKHDFGRIFKHRNVAKAKDLYNFGPFASGYDSSRVIDILRKCFLLRNCSDAEFKRREKPCLEHQIKKCSAPCVEYISKEDYQASINKATDFLSGKTSEIQQDLALKMQKYSEEQKYEKAAVFRDQIKSLTSIQAKQNINLSQVNNADMITLVQNKKDVCIYISFYRNGNNFGSKPYFDSIGDENPSEFLSQFLCQFYIDNPPPAEIFLNSEITDQNLVENLFTEISGKKTKIHIPKQGRKLDLIADQEKIATKLLEEKIAKNLSDKKLLIELKDKFNLKKFPDRIEIYDNSHTSTQNAVSGMVVFDQNGFNKSQYRKFNIRFDQSQNRDDTAMMKESLSRRFKHFKEPDTSHNSDPDLIIIDGGLPQLSTVKEVFLDLKINIPVICMAKGENRNAGEETYFTINAEKISITKNSALAFFLQRLRDEAHRFAITTHRAKRAKTVTKSKLDDLENIGAKRKKLLLNHFGSLEKIKQASISDLIKVSGISEKIAEKILEQLQ